MVGSELRDESTRDPEAIDEDLSKGSGICKARFRLSRVTPVTTLSRQLHPRLFFFVATLYMRYI